MSPGELRALFLRERAAFSATFPRCAGVGLVLLEGPCPVPPCAWRDLAAYYPARHTIEIARRALHRPRASVVALVRHELGHAADPTPGAPGAERRADRFAREVRGAPILYGADLVQTVDRRAKFRTRPAFLPR